MKSAPLRWPQFLACAYTLVAALAVHIRALPIAFLFLLAATLAIRVGLKRVSNARAIMPIRLLLLAAFGIAVLYTFHNVFGREAGSGLLAAMLTLKLVEAETRRDGLVLIAISCFLTMCGFLYDQGIFQTTLAAIALVVAVAGLHALQPMPAAAPAEASRVSWWPYPSLALGNTLRLLLLGAPFAIACFVFFPRFDAPLWGAPEDAFRGRTGISDRMSPGMLSSISLDDRVAFQATFEGEAPKPSDRYWRAITMWDFDGTTWSTSDWISHSGTQAPEAAGPPTRYEIMLEPTGQRWLPMLDAPLIPPPEARLMSDWEARTDHTINSVARYRGISALNYRAMSLPNQLRRLALILPPGRNPRTRALAEQWRREGADDVKVINNVLEKFHREFFYSLSPKTQFGINSIDDFLFDTDPENGKTGFCEHYASAFTVLMRAAGIPARVVTGYQGGELNSLGGFYVVRNSDAHAWSEVWLPERGWTRIDPTAAIAPDRIERGSRSQLRTAQAWYSRGGIWGALRERFDLAGYWWNRAIIEYSALRQRDLLQAMGIPEPTWQQLATALIVSVFIALTLAGLASRLRGKGRTDPLLMAYRAYCARLAQAGVARTANEGPLAYAQRAAQALPHAAQEIHTLSEGFARLRYAAVQLETTERDDWLRRARRFRLPRSATNARRRSS